ncbi:hypothetical protein SJAV_04800 [Sulfurisphaera javensis]|uniref:PIN domain-containing protein n=1 Tax=Sulfurisphaera javensis TaxID=2049879 RepID=A0AAT9GP22_9CREN
MDYSHNIIFDTAGFLAGLQNYYNKIYTTSFVVNEVKDLKSRELLDLAIYAGKVIIMEPQEKSYSIVKDVAKRSLALKLSATDLSVASLAYELKPSLVFTDDLMLQNLLLNLGIEYKSVKLNIKIKNKKIYEYVCTGCGKKFTKYVSICPYCGNKIITRSI